MNPPAAWTALGPVPIPLLVAGILLVLCGLVADHYPPWTSFHAEAPAFAAAAVLLVAAHRHATSLRMTSALWLLMALVATVWLQFAAGLLPYAGDAWVATVYLVAFGAAWAWGYGAAAAGKPQQPLVLACGVLLVLGLLASFQVLAQWFRLTWNFPGWVYDAAGARPPGNLGQSNNTATLLLMASAATAVFVRQGRFGAPVAWLLLFLFAGAMVLTQSRTALLAATVMAGLLLALSVRQAWLRPARKHVVCWIVLLYLMAWAVHSISWEFLDRGGRMEDMATVGSRPLMWRQFLLGLADSPWLGYGWLQVPAAQQVGALQAPGIEQATYGHNIVMDAMLFLGVPAGLLVAMLALAWLARRVGRLDTGSAPAAAGLFVLVPLAVHMQLELPHAYAYFLVPAGMLLGSFDAQTQPAASRAWRIRRGALFIVAAAWIPLLAALAYEYTLVEEDFRVNRFENRRLGRTPDDYRAPQLQLLTRLGDMAQAMRLRAVPGMPAADVDLLVRTSRRHTWAALHYRTALALGLNGRPQEAAHQLAVIQAMFPREIYEEGRADWLRLRDAQYPQLKAVELP